MDNSTILFGQLLTEEQAKQESITTRVGLDTVWQGSPEAYQKMLDEFNESVKNYQAKYRKGGFEWTGYFSLEYQLRNRRRGLYPQRVYFEEFGRAAIELKRKPTLEDEIETELAELPQKLKLKGGAELTFLRTALSKKRVGKANNYQAFFKQPKGHHQKKHRG